VAELCLNLFSDGVVARALECDVFGRFKDTGSAVCAVAERCHSMGVCPGIETVTGAKIGSRGGNVWVVMTDVERCRCVSFEVFEGGVGCHSSPVVES